MNVSFDDDDIPDIEEIYIKIIISLIKDKKFDKFEYVSDIMQQLDTENIELTQKMLEELKKEFNAYSMCFSEDKKSLYVVNKTGTEIMVIKPEKENYNKVSITERFKHKFLTTIYLFPKK